MNCLFIPMTYDLLYIFLLMSICKMPLCLKYNFVSTRPSLSGQRKDKHLKFLLLCRSCRCLCYSWQGVCLPHHKLWPPALRRNPCGEPSPHKRRQLPVTAPPARGSRRAGEAQAPAPPAWCSHQLCQVAPGGGRTGGGGGGMPAGRAAQWAGGEAGRGGAAELDETSLF